MKRWLPAADTIFQLICHHLPSPVTAQAYRIEQLYGGKKEDSVWKRENKERKAETAAGCFLLVSAMVECSPAGEVMMFVNKMVATGEKGRFYAFGRVFSGTITTGMKVRLQGPEHVQGGNADVSDGKTVQRLAQ